MSSPTGNKLTLDLLDLYVPIVREGDEAAAAKKAGEYADDDEKDTLDRACMAGEMAKETLLFAAMPLIRHLAKKEFQRRQNWNSQVTLDDLIQEGSGGLIRGLQAYKVGGPQTSPTNYLGQWILTNMRRNVEVIDNDFGVAYDAAEKFRKVRAIRSRLLSVLDREPTPEEILAASKDPVYKGNSKVGRLNRANEPKETLTLRVIEQEAEFRTRVGTMTRFVEPGEDDEIAPTIEQGVPLYNDPHTGDTNSVIEAGAAQGLADLLMEAFNYMGLPQAQREVISRKFGLHPYGEPESLRDISRNMNLRRDKVSGVIDAFSEEMTRAGGPFHQACSQWHRDDLSAIGMGWVLDRLGPYEPNLTGYAQQPQILMTPLVQPSLMDDGEDKSNAPKSAYRFVGHYRCSKDQYDFVTHHRQRASIAGAAPCPRCHDKVPLVDMTEL